MLEPFDARRIAAVKRHPVTRWRATIGLGMVSCPREVRRHAVECSDTKIVEVVVALDGMPLFVVGQRVTGDVQGTN